MPPSIIARLRLGIDLVLSGDLGMREKDHILIVDDDPNIGKSLSVILEQHGYWTERAYTGREALEKARATRFGVVLLDLRLPDAVGLDLVRPLKALCPDTAVIVITAYASLDTAVQAVNEGACGYIRKPFGISDVLAAVSQAVATRRTTAASLREESRAEGEGTLDNRRAEKALEESHDWFRMLFHRGNDAIFVHGVTSEGLPGRFLEVNDLACQRLGYTRAELLKLSPSQIDDPERHSDSRSIMTRLLTEESCVFEQTHVAKDGRKLLVEISSHVFELKGQTLVLSIARDISERKKAEDALRQSEERWRSLVENAPDIILTISRDGVIQFINHTLPGYEPEDVIGMSIREWMLPEHEPVLRSRLDEAFAEGRAVSLEFAGCGPTGTVSWYQARIGPIGPKGTPSGCIMIVTDITARTRAEERREASHRFLRIANRRADKESLLKDYVAEVKRFTTCATVGVSLLDEGGGIHYEARDGFCESFFELENPLSIHSDHGMCINVIRGDVDSSLPYYTDSGSFWMNGTSRFLSELPEGEKGKTRNACNAHGYESVALVPVRLGDRILGLIHAADPRENMLPLPTVELLEQAAMQLAAAIKRATTEEQLAHLATHDALTGLPTRAEFERRLEKALAHMRDSREGLALMVADLDRFKDINDTYGHSAGDQLLVAIGARLTGVLRSADTVCRLGGDEFVLLLSGLARPQDAAALATKLLQDIRKPVALDEHTLHVTISIGIALSPNDGDDGETLLKRADIAMYRAKHAGRDTYQWFDESHVSSGRTPERRS